MIKEIYGGKMTLTKRIASTEELRETDEYIETTYWQLINPATVKLFEYIEGLAKGTLCRMPHNPGALYRKQYELIRKIKRQ
jgi:hypothetical protein